MSGAESGSLSRVDLARVRRQFRRWTLVAGHDNTAACASSALSLSHPRRLRSRTPSTPP